MSALPAEFGPARGQGTPARPVPFLIIPALGAPAAVAPALAAPASGTPASSVPAADTPDSGTPVPGPPASAAPVCDAPDSGTPVPGPPASAAPVCDAPDSGTPVPGPPASAAPVCDAPDSGTPGQAAPQQPGGSPPRPVPRARPVSRRPGVRACSGVSRAALMTAQPRPAPSRPAAAAVTPPLRLTGRGRSAVAACAVVVAALLWFAVATAAHAAAHGAPPGPARPVMTQVVVQPGQTLWSIATRADPSADPRLVVQRIVAVNKLTGESVAAGQRLWVPRG